MITRVNKKVEIVHSILYLNTKMAHLKTKMNENMNLKLKLKKNCFGMVI